MNKRVLLIIGSFKTGGAERVTINTGSELEKRGYEVYYALQRGIFELPNSVPKERIFVLRESNSQNRLYKLYALFVGIFIVRLKVRPRVVIGFSRLSSFLACFSLASHVIARFDANPYRLSKKQRAYANLVFRWPFVRKIVVPSSGMYSAIAAKRRTHREKLLVIPNTIDTARILAKSVETAVVSFPFPYICAMGRFSYDKNFEMLIKAYHKSKIRGHYKLVMIGDGKLWQELSGMVAALGMEQEVVFAGFLKNPYPVLKEAKLLVNSSRNESFCNVILEGLCLSLPVVATDCDYGPSDMIKDRWNGFLIPSDDLQAMVDVLDEIADNPATLEAVRMNARESSKRFELSNVIEKWVNLLN